MWIYLGISLLFVNRRLVSQGKMTINVVILYFIYLTFVTSMKALSICEQCRSRLFVGESYNRWNSFTKQQLFH